MFDHVEYSVSDIAGARRLYSLMCAAMGAEEMFFDGEIKELGIGKNEVVHLLLTEGEPTTPRMHICFAAPGKDEVISAYDAALHGGATCNGPPGYRDDYGPGYFAAFVRDADGHNIEMLFREAS